MFWLNAVVLALCGALFSFALPPTNIIWLSFLIIPLFALVARSEHSKDAFGYGFWFAIGCFAQHLRWLPASFAENLSPAFWLTFPPLLIVLGCMWGLVCYISRFLGGKGRHTLWVLPGIWVLTEWLRTLGEFAFPWGTLGYIWIGTPVAQVADVVGVYGLSLLTCFVAALISVPFVAPPSNVRSYSMKSSQVSNKGWQAILFAVMLVAIPLSYGIVKSQNIATNLNKAPTEDTTEITTESKLHYALLVQQGEVDLFGRTAGEEIAIDVYSRLTAKGIAASDKDIDLVAWPEGAILSGYLDAPSSGLPLREQIEDAAGTVTVITGGASRDFNDSYNTVFSIARSQVMDSYNKSILVPFGEAFPFIGFLSPVYDAIFRLFGLPPQFSRTAGTEIKPLQTPVGFVGTYICYESIFPRIARTMVDEGAQVLLNVSNDAWFGKGQGAEQHFLMGTMRAIETRRYILRAGIDGITAVVNPLGEVTQKLERGIPSSLVGAYALRSDKTLFVRYGDYLLAVLLIYLAVVSAIGLLKNPN